MRVAQWMWVVGMLVACRHDRNANLPPPGPTPGFAAAPAAAPTRAEDLEALRANFQRVHFDLDSASIGPAGRAALDANAAILQRHPDVRVEVQGHADARGTVDYNLALGFRRSAAVVDHLRARGVSAQQLAAVSYGEEIPLARGDGEPVWAQNRRAEFRVIAGPQTVEGTVASR